MIELNIARVIALRGFQEPVTYLVNTGIAGYTARRMLSNKSYLLSMPQLEHLCRHLRCTPNDLYRYKPDNNTSENLPLNELKYEDQDFISQIRELSLAEMKELTQLIQERKKK